MRTLAIVLALMTVSVTTTRASAAEVSAAGLSPWAQPNATVSVDCADFQKQPSGAWKILRATDVGIGSSDYNTGGGGYLVSGLIQNDGANIYGAVDRACKTRSTTQPRS
jgi:hypothetical protein